MYLRVYATGFKSATDISECIDLLSELIGYAPLKMPNTISVFTGDNIKEPNEWFWEHISHWANNRKISIHCFREHTDSIIYLKLRYPYITWEIIEFPDTYVTTR